MKKFLVLAAVVLGLGLSSVNAQEGKFYIGTTGVSFSNKASGDNFGAELMTGFYTGNNKTVWGIAPELGYFVTNDLALGLGIGYTDYDGSSAFGASPYVRWFAHRAGNFGFYVQGGVDYMDIKDYAIIGDSNMLTIGINPGIAYGLSDHFSVNAAFGFLGYSKQKDVDGTFGLNVDMSTLSFGLSYMF